MARALPTRSLNSPPASSRVNPSLSPAPRVTALCGPAEGRMLCRGSRAIAERNSAAALMTLPAAEHSSPARLERLVHDYRLKDELDGSWAMRPLELAREAGRSLLVLAHYLSACSARRWSWIGSHASRSASSPRCARAISAASSTK
jgi:hypothetical protein